MPAPDAAAAAAWLRKAEHDLRTARLAAEAEPPILDTAVYHCQQAAEKALKGFLVFHEQTFAKTHDLEVLLDLAVQIDSSLGELADAADLLTPYATRFRYPSAAFLDDPTREEFDEALGYAQTIYHFVCNVLPPDARL